MCRVSILTLLDVLPGVFVYGPVYLKVNAVLEVVVKIFIFAVPLVFVLRFHWLSTPSYLLLNRSCLVIYHSQFWQTTLCRLGWLVDLTGRANVLLGHAADDLIT